MSSGNILRRSPNIEKLVNFCQFLLIMVMSSLWDLLSSQMTGAVVFPPKVKVAWGCLTVLSEIFDGDVKMFQDLSGVQGVWMIFRSERISTNFLVTQSRKLGTSLFQRFRAFLITKDWKHIFSIFSPLWGECDPYGSASLPDLHTSLHHTWCTSSHQPARSPPPGSPRQITVQGCRDHRGGKRDGEREGRGRGELRNS